MSLSVRIRICTRSRSTLTIECGNSSLQSGSPEHWGLGRRIYAAAVASKKGMARLRRLRRVSSSAVKLAATCCAQILSTAPYCLQMAQLVSTVRSSVSHSCVKLSRQACCYMLRPDHVHCPVLPARIDKLLSIHP